MLLSTTHMVKYNSVVESRIPAVSFVNVIWLVFLFSFRIKRCVTYLSSGTLA